MEGGHVYLVQLGQRHSPSPGLSLPVSEMESCWHVQHHERSWWLWVLAPAFSNRDCYPAGVGCAGGGGLAGGASGDLPPPPRMHTPWDPFCLSLSSVPLEGVGAGREGEGQSSGRRMPWGCWQAAARSGDYRVLQFRKRKMGKEWGPIPVFSPKAAESSLTLGSSWCLQSPVPPIPPHFPQSLQLTSRQSCREGSWVTHCLP